MTAYAQTGDREGVGRMLDRIAEIVMARGRTPIFSATYFAGDPARAEQWAARLATSNTSAFEKLFAHDLYLTAGNLEKANRVEKEIDPSQLDPAFRLLLEVRNFCANGRDTEGRTLTLDRLGGIRSRDGLLIPLARVGAPDFDMRHLLPSDETPAGRALVSQFLVSPYFDLASFPRLRAELERRGVSLGEASALAYACRPQA